MTYRLDKPMSKEEKLEERHYMFLLNDGFNMSILGRERCTYAVAEKMANKFQKDADALDKSIGASGQLNVLIAVIL